MIEAGVDTFYAIELRFHLQVADPYRKPGTPSRTVVVDDEFSSNALPNLEEAMRRLRLAPGY
jgi:hypothetical protein